MLGGLESEPDAGRGGSGQDPAGTEGQGVNVWTEYNVVLWGGPSDGQELTLASTPFPDEQQWPPIEAVWLPEISDNKGNRYVRTNRIAARRWVYRYEGRGHGASP